MESNPDVWVVDKTPFHQGGHKDNFPISEQKCQVSWEMLLAVHLCEEQNERENETFLENDR